MSTDLHDVANLLLTKLNVDNVFGSQWTMVQQA
jgi:hypothetical protein